MNVTHRTHLTATSVLLLTLALALLLVSTPALAAPPANDDFDNAMVISALPYTHVLDTSAATTAPDDPDDCYDSSASVWYSFTAPSAMPVAVTISGSTFQATVAVYTGTRGNLTQVACASAYGDSVWRQVDATASQTYYIMLGSAWNGAGGLVSLEVEELVPPPNDNAADATVIGTLPFSETVDTRGATTEPGDSDCADAHATIWYSFTPADNTRVEANVSLPNHPAAMAVYTGTAGSLTRVVCYPFWYSSPLQIDLFAGETYYLMVGTGWGYTGGDLTISLSGTVLPAAPANDDFDAAEVVALPFTDSLDTSGATRAFDDPDCANSAATVWYRFTATTNAILELSAGGSDYNVTVSAYTGTTGSLSQLGCIETMWSGNLRVNVQAGETYYFMAGSAWNGLGGSLSLSIVALEPPANDDFDNAGLIAALPFTVDVDTSTATRAADDPACYDAGATVWYAFTPPRDMRLQFSAINSSYSSAIGVYTGSRGSLAEVACYSYYYWYELPKVDVAAGETYYLMIGSSYSNTGGTLTLKVEELIPPPNDDIQNAAIIAALPYSHTVDFSGAMRATDDPYCGSGPNVWYKFTPTRSLRLEVETYGYDTAVSLYTGVPGNLTQLACQSLYTGQSLVRDVWAGETYYMMVSAYYGTIPGDLLVKVHELPRNDDIADRTIISALPFMETIDATYATWGLDDPTSCGWQGSPTIWYAYQPATGMRLQAKVTRNVPYLGLSVYTGSPTNLQPVGCVDYQSQPLVFEAEAGRTYFIMIAAAPDASQRSILTFSLGPAGYGVYLPMLRR
jgi:hypothetical protein